MSLFQAIKIGDKNLFNPVEHLFEDYAAIVSGSSFPKHAAIKFGGSAHNIQCFIVNAAEKDEQIDELTHDKIKCATVLGFGETYVDAKFLTMGTLNTPSGIATVPILKYLVVFKDGRQAIITTRLAESQHAIERILF